MTAKYQAARWNMGAGLPGWLFWGQICKFWPFFNSFGLLLFFKKGQMKSGFFWPLRFLCRFGSFKVDFGRFKDDFGRFLGTGRFLDTISGRRMINFHWKLCTIICNFLFCCFTLIDLQFQVTLQQNQKFREVHWWSELHSFYVYVYTAFQKRIWVF